MWCLGKTEWEEGEEEFLLYIKETIPAYEVQLQEAADCKDALWCNLVTGHTTLTIGVVYRCPNITIQNNEKIHNAISEASKARRTYSRLCLFTNRLNCRDPIGSRPCSVHCPDYSTYTLTTRSRPSEYLNAATWCLLSVMYMHHGAIWCLDTHQ